jgi:putative DNA primase/helicase
MDGKPVWPRPTVPMTVARQYAHLMHGDDTLRCWRGNWMMWEPAGRWAEIERAAVSSGIYEALEHAVFVIEQSGEDGSLVKVAVPWEPNRKKVSDVVDALEAVAFLPGSIAVPTWLDEAGGPPANEIVAVENGLLHVTSRRLLDHDPRFFTLVAVPFAYEPDATCDRWLAFLDELWPDDADSIAALQEFFGYVISGRTDLQKILLLIGPTRGGKGVIARVLEALLGKGNIAGPTLASLNTNFGLSPLLGKSLAIISDARLDGRTAHQVVERLLAISGEDAITVDRKYREPWTGRIPARLFMISNEVPSFGDASAAIVGRFVALRLTRSWYGHESGELDDELHAELPGILGWALDGLDRLAARGRFTQPKSADDIIMQLKESASPVAAFVRERCEVGADRQVGRDVLFEAWRDWCEETGAVAGDKTDFGRRLRAAVPELGEHRPRTESNFRPRMYRGLGLR